MKLIQINLFLAAGIISSYSYSMNLNQLDQQLKRLLQELTSLQQSLKKFTATPVTIPPALPNLGNTCYMNSVIQAIYSITPLNNILINKDLFYPQNSLARKYIALIRGFQSGSFLQPLQQFANQTDYTMQATTAVCGAGAQQDATEFLTQLLDSLTASSKQSLNNFLQNLFNITLQPVLYCGAIKRTFLSKPDTGNQLMLPVRDPNTGDLLPNDLTEILKAFFAPEKNVEFKPENYAAQNCTKSVYITQLPPILIISLRRFDIDPMRAIASYGLAVQVPLQLNIASMTPIIPGMDQSQIPAQASGNYTLLAAMVHLGGLAGGHYVAYVRNPLDEWYLCNDQRITKVTQKELLDGITRGYAYIYKKVNAEQEISKGQEKLEKELKS